MQSGITSTRVFAENAPQLAELGLAVLPLGGADLKKPLIRGFNKWKRPQAPHVVAAHAEKFPDANVGVVLGPSRLVVVDVDDRSHEAEAEHIFGFTPLRVRTGRGTQFYYSAPAASMRQRNLRSCGLAIDIKGNTGYVVAPPSLHKNGATYTLDGCDWSALKELPSFSIAALNALFEERRPCHREPPDGCVLREGERHVGLNSQLCHAVARHQSLEALLDHAEAINQTCVPPLPAKEVVGIAKSVWDDFRAGKIKGWHGGPSVVKTSRAEMQDLLNYGRHGPDALALLVLLRANHAARCLRGEHFAITPKSIVEHGHLPGFTRQRIENARDLALKSGQLIRVRPFDRKTHAPAQYKLAQAQ